MAIRRHRYRMSHHWLCSANVGQLTPVFCQEVLPGDTWFGSTSCLHRLGALNHPAFVSIKTETYFFYVPNRILWDEWEDFIVDPDSSASLPTVVADTEDQEVNSLTASLGITGIPTGNVVNINALPVRAYHRIWNEFFRDQDDPEVGEESRALRSCNHAKGYLTTARDEVQIGDEPEIPVVTASDPNRSFIRPTQVRDQMKVQRYREHRAQFGERYTDYLAAMGITRNPVRLDRPEFCARSKFTMGISDVVTTADTTSGSTGEYAGHGIAGGSLRFRRRTFSEHGWLMGLLVIRPRMQIRHRLDRQYWPLEWSDYFQPELATQTQEPIHIHEVNSRRPISQLNDNWGWTARYERYRNSQDVLASGISRDFGINWTAAKSYGTGNTPSRSQIRNVSSGQFRRLFQESDPSNSIQNYIFCNNQIAVRRIVGRRPK